MYRLTNRYVTLGCLKWISLGGYSLVTCSICIVVHWGGNNSRDFNARGAIAKNLQQVLAVFILLAKRR